MTQDARIPVMLLTGFLGSGKTTLLNAWLGSPALEKAAVIVNEFGDIGIDHALIASSSDQTIELTTGCLCCTVRGDLVNTLEELRLARGKGAVRPFDRVVIETTGLVDPAPVIQALMTSPVARTYQLRQVITTVDAIHGSKTMEEHPESVKQAAVADELVVTKTDLADGAVDALISSLKVVNPGARIFLSRPGAIPSVNALTANYIYDPTTKSADAVGWLNAEAYRQVVDPHHYGRHEHPKGNRHNADVRSFCLEYSDPLHWEHVANWLDALVLAHGSELLRVKGIIDVVGRRRPIVVQAVQHMFHPPFELIEWPSGPRRSRIVFITRNLSFEYVCEVFDTIRQRRIAPEVGVGGAPIVTTASSSI